MSRRPFVVRDHVRWSDCDPAGIIRWDAYTRFIELAETELLRAIGVSYVSIRERFGVTIPRAALHIDYVSPSMLDELLEVHSYVSRVGRTSLTLNFDIYGAGGVLRADGYQVLVAATQGVPHGAPQPWPEPLLALLAPFRMTTDEARVTGPQ